MGQNYNNLLLNVNDVEDQFRIRQWYALFTLYYSTNGPSWFTNWGNFGSRECSLHGVECTQKQDFNSGIAYDAVIGVDLRSNSLNGRLPYDLAMLSHLEYIDVSENTLVGTIPELLITSTVSMSNFSIYHNTISGTLSTSFGTSWVNMQVFDVANNTIRGTIPESLYQWSESTEIDLSGNMLTGTIPQSICSKFFTVPIVYDPSLPPCNS